MLLTRTVTEEIVSCLNSHEIIFLLGTRQTGKTTLTHLVAKASAFKSEEIFFFDFEYKENRNIFDVGSVTDLRRILSLEGIEPDLPTLLIFDEIQLLSDPANLLKLLHDHFPALRILATGSSSLRIKHKFSDSLAGRKRIFLIHPLSFDEFLFFKGEDRLLRLRKMFRNSNRLEKIELGLYKDADKVVAVTNAFKNNLIDRGINPEKIEDVTNGSNMQLFSHRDTDQI